MKRISDGNTTCLVTNNRSEETTARPFLAHFGDDGGALGGGNGHLPARPLALDAYLGATAAELSARRELALEWFNMLHAPIKRIYTFENAAHAPAFEQCEAFTAIMTETVLPESYSPR